MAKSSKAISAKGKFSNVFLRPEPTKAKLLVDYLDEYLYDVKNPKGMDGHVAIKRFRPSQLAKSNCVRKMIYEYLGAEYETDLAAHDAKLHRVFDNGHAVHDRIQGYLSNFHKWTGGKISLIGRWRCHKCDAKYGFAPKVAGAKSADHWCVKPDKCKCGSESFEYCEVDVEIPSHNIYGTADGILEIEGEKFVLEIKSMNPNGFNSMSSVPSYYRPQINLYMHGLGIFESVFLVECKGTQEIKEMRYAYESSVLKPIFAITKTASGYLKKKQMPPKFTDPAEVKANCRFCEYRKICALTDDFKEQLRVADYEKPVQSAGS